MDCRRMIEETARALAFLSRIPVSDRYFHGHDGSLSQTVAAFPLAAIALTVPSSLLLLLLDYLGTDKSVTGLLVLTAQILITGALHEDGLADTADGLGAGHDRERALSIMKDSRLGTYGALALLLSISLRVAALGALLDALAPHQVAIIWIMVAIASRTALLWHWTNLPPARANGIAAGVGAPHPNAVRIAYGCAAASILVLAALASVAISAALALVIAATVVWAFTCYIRRKLAGHTGDTIGASQQLTEISGLVALVILT